MCMDAASIFSEEKRVLPAVAGESVSSRLGTHTMVSASVIGIFFRCRDVSRFKLKISITLLQIKQIELNYQMWRKYYSGPCRIPVRVECKRTYDEYYSGLKLVTGGEEFNFLKKRIYLSSY